MKEQDILCFIARHRDEIRDILDVTSLERQTHANSMSVWRTQADLLENIEKVKRGGNNTVFDFILNNKERIKKILEG